MRSALETQRRRGEIGVDETRATVLGLGYGEDDVEVIDIQEHLGDPAATPGVLVGVVTGPRTCLVGAVTKRRVTLEVILRLRCCPDSWPHSGVACLAWSHGA